MDKQHFEYVVTEIIGKTQYNKVIEMYDEPGRFYHNRQHLDAVISTLNVDNLNPMQSSALCLAALYHDAVYDVERKDNEQRSLDLFMSHSDEMDHEQKEMICMLIMSTKNHSNNYDHGNILVDRLIEADLAELTHGDMPTLLSVENRIFKEYQRYNYAKYREGRIDVLRGIAPLIKKINKHSNIDHLIRYVETRHVRIGIYPGTFYPFHKGHMEILEKAEKMFDKVIIAVGSNPDKADSTARTVYANNLRGRMYREVVRFFGTLPGYIENHIADELVSYTIVKGVRNSGDYDYEKMQLRYMEDMGLTVPIVMIQSSRDMEHVSSSGIRSLEGISPQLADNYKVKELKRK